MTRLTLLAGLPAGTSAAASAVSLPPVRVGGLRSSAAMRVVRVRR